MITLILLLSNLLFSQNLDNPLNPIEDKNPKLHNIGLTLGFGQNYANGDHYVLCDNCVFNGGVGFGSTIGLFYEREATNWLWYGVLVRYDDLGIESMFIENQSLQAEGTEDWYIIPMEQKAVLDLSYINFTPYVSFKIANWFSINTGLNVGLNVINNVKHTETPVSNTIQDPETGEIIEIDVSNPDPSKTGDERYVLMDEEMPDVNTPYLTFYTNFAFPIELENQSKIVPSIGFDFPLGNVSNFGNNFNIGTWRLYLSYSYPLITEKKDVEVVE